MKVGLFFFITWNKQKNSLYLHDVLIKMLYMRKVFMMFLLLLNAVFCGYSQNVCGTIEFVVNTNVFVYNENYYNFMYNTVPYIQEHCEDIDSILIIGSASPEGKKDFNIHLADIRASKIYSCIRNYVPGSKVIVKNDYSLFLEKTKLTEEDYKKLRATYIEIYLKEAEEEIMPVVAERDTIYIRDTIYYSRVDTVWLREKPKIFPVLAVKTNLAADIIAAPNIQAELYTWIWGLSLEFDYTCPWWHKDYDTYFYYQVLNGIVGVRKYLNNKYTGYYIGIYGNTAIYDLCFLNKDKGWQGEVYGAGLSGGYVFQNKKYPRLKFEPYVKFGWFNTKFDTYHASQPWNEKYYYNWYLRASDFVPRRFKMNYFGPTAIGFNLTFDLICIRKY